MRKNLQAVQQHIENTAFTSKGNQQLADQLVVDISKVLEHPDEIPFSRYQYLREKMQKAIESFEDEHPQLTEFINRSIYVLNGMGM